MKNKYKTLSIIFAVVILLLVAGITTLSILYVNKKSDEGVHYSINAISHDSTLVGEDAYVKIDGVKYYFDIPYSNHSLVCDYNFKGGETVEIHLSILSDMKICEYEIVPSSGEIIHESGFGGERDYTFTTKANKNYDIIISFPAM